MSWSYQKTPDLTQDQFLCWQSLLEQKTGINFSLHKSILQTGLNQRMRQVECDDYQQYYSLVLDEKSGSIEWIALLNSLTVGETRFFRHPEAFDYLEHYLIDRFRLCSWQKRPLEIWSVGCSTGEETYSLAMLAQTCLDARNSTQYFGVIGSDISIAALADARKGIYQTRKLQYIDPILKSRFFEPFNRLESRVVNTLRDRICFVRANMMELDSAPIENMDVIFCQNVLVYFRRDRQHYVLNQLAKRLRPGGVLITGVGETAGWKNNTVEPVADKRIQAYIKK